MALRKPFANQFGSAHLLCFEVRSISPRSSIFLLLVIP